MASKGKKSLRGQLQIDLHDLGMTAFHRVGLAGLFMTLERLRSDEAPEGSAWDISHTRHVELSWGDDGPEPLLKFIFERGLTLGPDGIVDFMAWHGVLGQRPSPDARLIAQDILLGSFIQHGRTRTAEGQRLLQLDPDEKTPPKTYLALSSFVHQQQAETISAAVLKNKPVRMTGSFLLGAVERHPGTTQTRMEATAAEYLALCFAPVGAIGFRIHGHKATAQQQYAIAAPDVENLKNYARMRRRMVSLNAEALNIPSPEDASLQIALARSRGAATAKGTGGCTVAITGSQPWNTQQKVRTRALKLKAPDLLTLAHYRLAFSLPEFQTRRLLSKNKREIWYATSPSRGAISRALCQSRPWWEGVSKAFQSADDNNRRLFLSNNERKGLQTMVKHAIDPQEKLFVDACHKAMRQIYGSIRDQTSDAGTQFGQKANTEMTRIRASFLRAKNASSFRDALVDFWGRASRSKLRFNSVLRQNADIDGNEQPGWVHILPMLDDDHWRKARDLAIVALLSYPAGQSLDDPEATGDDLETSTTTATEA